MAYIDGKDILFSAQVTSGGGAEIVNTLDGNEADKAPSVQAVNDGITNAVDAASASLNEALDEKIGGVSEEIKSVGEKVDEIDFKVGRSYSTRTAYFSSNSLNIPDKHVGTHVSFETITPTYGLLASGLETPVSNVTCTPFDENGDGDFDPEVYQVSINRYNSYLRITLNSLSEDADENGVFIGFDPIEILGGQAISVGIVAKSTGFTSDDNNLLLDLVYDSRVPSHFSFEDPAKLGNEKKVRKNASSKATKITGVLITNENGANFDNYVFELRLYTTHILTSGFPKHVYRTNASGGSETFLKDMFAYFCTFAEENGVSLDWTAFDEYLYVYYNYIDVASKELVVSVVMDEASGKPVVSDNVNRIPLIIPSTLNFDTTFPSVAGDTISLNIYGSTLGEFNDSQILYVTKS